MCNCDKSYSEPFCFPEKKKAIDYIYEWIDVAELALKEQGKDISLIKAWKESVENDIASIPTMQADIDHLKTLEVDGSLIDLNKLGAVFDLFTFDEDNEIIGSRIPTNVYGAPIVGSQERLVISTPNYGMQAWVAFNTDENTYLSGKGTFVSLPDFPQTYISNTRTAILELIRTNKLQEGAWYKIVDANSYVFDEHASTFGPSLNVLVYAINTSTLSEDAYIIEKVSDPVTLATNDGRIWKGKYCINNDVSRFGFINDYEWFIQTSNDDWYVRTSTYSYGYQYWKKLPGTAYEFKESIEPYLAAGEEIPEELLPGNDAEEIFTRISNPYITLEGAPYNALVWDEDSEYGIPTGFDLYRAPIQETKITGLHIQKIIPVNAGVIYELKDEYNNIAPFDFKSVQFFGVTQNPNLVGFTFSKFEEGSTNSYVDASSLADGKVANNIIEPMYEFFVDINGTVHTRQILNRIIHNAPCINNHYHADCTDMAFLGKTNNNVWLGNASVNYFGKDVEDNVFYMGFNHNGFSKHHVRRNTFMQNFQDNDFNLPEYSYVQPLNGVTPDFEVSDNVISQGFEGNTITMPRFIGNNIKVSGKFNTFPGYIANLYSHTNTLYTDNEHNLVNQNIGNNCQDNIIKGLYGASSIGNSFKHNLIEGCSSCTFGDNISASKLTRCINTFCVGNNTGLEITSYLNAVIDYGVSYIRSSGTQNIHIYPGIKGTATDYKEIPANPYENYKEYHPQTVLSYEI